uniref:Uncharacterized protein n=1 Tax=Pseudictyota dubia TaxID=2749911 RepID=A0A7R9W9C0_9STRA|mmetsp:Transcript_38238/g.70600  ORF Transcript_38238/g.70600 Transcript_38238/m.70600 type:complete len:336 (+) Transcript_38238:70-1077(+)|eukprot:CAMPEP_0197460374 /NCGR_PEP_ID=MMETSP1175-20131217/53891_1 /TAXON_ID=1003142 /ORGANISM="Triceratium dubium, Strain CCMP147" /LENGTH=335 /DNA_ID=CAMNT_0042995451 /DNA_START=179 /DNA_END=1186 /DNA_ORIENTATION=+
MSEKEGENESEEIWWEASANHPIHTSLASFPSLALEVTENLALAAMGRMCRKGRGWDFPRCVRVDPRMRNAEYAVDKKSEVKKLTVVLEKIVDETPANQQPASLIAYHVALRDAYKAFEEPENGTPWEEIQIAHKCMERCWYEQYSEPTAFGLTQAFEDAWFSVFQELDKSEECVKSLQSSPPPDHVLNEMCEIGCLFGMLSRYDEEEMEKEGMHFGKWFQDIYNAKKKEAEAKKEDEQKKRRAEYLAKKKRRRKRHATANRKRLKPGVDVCYECCNPLEENSDAFPDRMMMDSEDEDISYGSNDAPLFCVDCVRSDWSAGDEYEDDSGYTFEIF